MHSKNFEDQNQPHEWRSSRQASIYNYFYSQQANNDDARSASDEEQSENARDNVVVNNQMMMSGDAGLGSYHHLAIESPMAQARDTGTPMLLQVTNTSRIPSSSHPVGSLIRRGRRDNTSPQRQDETECQQDSSTTTGTSAKQEELISIIDEVLHLISEDIEEILVYDVTSSTQTLLH